MHSANEIIVSVIMGVRYKRENIALLQRAVDSILGQSFPYFEFLICDDGSMEDAKRYLEHLSDARVKLVRRADCLDLSSKLNLCLREARGRFIARMDDDDWSYPERFEREIRYLTENESVAFVGCNVTLIRNGEKIGERRLPERPEVKDFYFAQPFIHSALMFRREAIEDVGGYSESKSCLLCEDYDLLLRLYEHGFSGGNIQENLLDYTISATAKGNRTMAHRFNETVTRWRRFKALKQFPKALPFVVKPILVGMLPEKLLWTWKLKRLQRANEGEKEV